MSEVSGLEAVGALVRDSTASGVGRRVLLLRADVLPPGLSKPHHLRLARAALDPLTLADRARLHELPTGRLAVSWRGEAAPLIREVFETLDTLLQDSPLDAPGIPELVRLYDLPADGASLMRDAAEGLPASPAAAPEPSPPVPREIALAPLDPAGLELIERRLAVADMSRFARRQPVCRLGPRGMLLAWEERFLSIPELIETVASGRNAEADPWLFLRLTRLLDRRMLSMLSGPDELRGAGPFSLTLNVASVLSPDFLRFDTVLPSGLRGQVIIELLPADVLADPAAFAFARNFARARGYKLALGRVTAALLPMLNLPLLEVDFVKLCWSPELAELGRELAPSAIARWILCRAETQDAVDWGRGAGIGLFQGAAASPARTPPPASVRANPSNRSE